MGQINMNQAATSGTKSPAVVAAVTEWLQKNSHLSAGRGGGELDDAALALEARLALAEWFGAAGPQQVVFTSGATAALNMAICGLVRPGCHVLSTGIEHNAVARVLHRLQQQGVIEAEFLPCAPDGTLDPGTIAPRIRPNTRGLVMSHASNMLGTILDAAQCFSVAKQHGLFTVLDAAQSAGHIPVQMDANTDVIAFVGHKGLGGLAGIGGMVLAPGVEKEMDPWLAGGTGSHSDSLEMPTFLPDRYEPGTPNTLGILSLGTSVRQLADKGIDAIRRTEQALATRFLEQAAALPLRIHGPRNAGRIVPVVSVTSPGMGEATLARRLQNEDGIITRSGLHCAPLAHKTAGTFPRGTLRFSFGAATTEAEIDTVMAALGRILATTGQKGRP